MSGEKQNKQDGWQSRLETLQFLPGEPGVDQETVWDNLYARLHKNPARKRIGWYRIAAACLLLGVSVFIWEKTDFKKDFKNTNPQRKDNLISNPVIIRLPAVRENRTSRDITSVKSKKPVRLIPQQKQNEFILLQQHQVPVPVAVLDSFQGRRPDLLLSINLKTPPKEMADPPKKKLKVVHLNELDEPLEEDNLARSSVRRGFRLKWPGQSNPAGLGPASGQTGYEILKLNLSTPN